MPLLCNQENLAKFALPEVGNTISAVFKKIGQFKENDILAHTTESYKQLQNWSVLAHR